MKIEFDLEKDKTNKHKHQISLAEASRFDFSRAAVVPDDRFDYGEARYRAYGRIEGRLYMLAFTLRGDTLRAISLRKANAREGTRYG